MKPPIYLKFEQAAREYDAALISKVDVEAKRQAWWDALMAMHNYYDPPRTNETPLDIPA